jgi:hypothetical protein
MDAIVKIEHLWIHLRQDGILSVATTVVDVIEKKVD